MRDGILMLVVLPLVLGAASAAAAPSVERGAYLVEGPGACGNCHTPMGPDGPVMEQHLGGRLVEQSDAFTAIAGNITPGGRVAGWSDAAFIRAIREGIRPDGSVLGPPMPITLYRGLSDDDVASMVMYLRTVAAVENDPGESVYNIPLPPAYGPPVETVASIPAGVTVDYGAYLANAVAHCMECHTSFGPQGPMFDTHLGAGGFAFHGPWGTVIAPNITAGPEGVEKYSDAELAQMITTGVRPDGSPMLPPMPYGNFAAMTPEDLAAVILYLRSVPPLPFGG
jgi:mono/diheme cytochrome c family protein